MGKGTLIAKLREGPHGGSFGFSCSHTTRGPREGEVDGEHYNFSDKETMSREIEEGKFLEHAEVHGNFYGTSFAAVEQVIAEGKCCILDIDVQGAQSVRANGMAASFVFVNPPSMELLEQRLRDRGTETEEAIQKRLGGAASEIDASKTAGLYDNFIVNDKLETAYARFEEIALAALRGDMAPPAAAAQEAPAEPELAAAAA